MHKFATKFADFCEKDSRFNLDEPINYEYRSLPICIIDCVYSLRTHYNTVTIPIIDNYAKAYLNSDRYSTNDTVSKFIENVQKCGGPTIFADKILNNHGKLGGKASIPKEKIVYKVAEYLKSLKIETIQDFKNFENQELLSIVLYGVKGLGDAGVNYLFMLAGDPNRCKPDVHIHQAIKESCGEDISNQECQALFTDAVTILKRNHKFLTVRQLDGIIWGVYRK